MKPPSFLVIATMLECGSVPLSLGKWLLPLSPGCWPRLARNWAGLLLTHRLDLWCRWQMRKHWRPVCPLCNLGANLAGRQTF